MQQNSMAEKARWEYDGEEIIGFVSASEMSVNTDTIEIPEFRRTRLISNGIEKIPVVEMVYEIRRGTNTLKFWQDFYYKKQVKDVTKIRTDAHGDEFARTLLPGCECVKYTEPEVDLATPKFAQVMATLVPWDMIPIDAE